MSSSAVPDIWEACRCSPSVHCNALELCWKRTPNLQKWGFSSIGLIDAPYQWDPVPPNWFSIRLILNWVKGKDGTTARKMVLRAPLIKSLQLAAYHRVGSPPSYIANVSTNKAFISWFTSCRPALQLCFSQSSYIFISLKFILLCPTSLKVALHHLRLVSTKKS